MTTETIAAPLGELRAASTAGGGTALTTTAAQILFPDKTAYFCHKPRNFATAVVTKVGLLPYLQIIKTSDLLATVGNLTDYSDAGQDNVSATTVVLNSFNTIAGLSALYIGSHIPFRGVRCLVLNTNAVGSVLTVKYWNGSAWTATSGFADGTSAAGATIGQSGIVSWTVPSAWAPTTLKAIADGVAAPAGPADMFWTRWEVSVQLGASVAISHTYGLPASTAAYMELFSGDSWGERVDKGIGGFAGVEALTDAGTANLVVNVAAAQGRGF